MRAKARTLLERRLASLQILLLILALLQLAMLFHLERRLWSRPQEDAAPEAAQEPPNPQAAQAMERFNTGVANILAYDPFGTGGNGT